MRVVISPVIAYSVTWALAFAAFVISAVTVGTCFFVKAFVEEDSRFSLFGFYQLEGERSCVYYPSDFVISASHKTAKAMATIAAALGGIAMVTLSCQIFIKLGRKSWMGISFLLFVACVCQGLSFLIFNDTRCKQQGVNCRLGDGGVLGIIAVILYFLAGMAVFRTKPPKNECITFDLSQVARNPPNQEQAPAEALPDQEDKAEQTKSVDPFPEKDETFTFTPTSQPAEV